MFNIWLDSLAMFMCLLAAISNTHSYLCLIFIFFASTNLAFLIRNTIKYYKKMPTDKQ